MTYQKEDIQNADIPKILRSIEAVLIGKQNFRYNTYTGTFFPKRLAAADNCCRLKLKVLLAKQIECEANFGCVHYLTICSCVNVRMSRY